MSSNPERWLLRSVTVAGEHQDCRVAGGRVVELGRALESRDGERVLEAGGGALLPGLVDHHVHVLALAAARRSLDLHGGDLPAAGPDAAPIAASACASTAWLRVVGLGRLVSVGELDTRWPERPVKAQHRSGAVWMLNSAAIDRLAPTLTREERRSGHVWRGDERLRAPDDGIDGRLLAEVGRDLAAWGITGLTDATPQIAPSAQRLIEGSLPQHVRFLGGTDPVMPVKVVLADHRPPSYDGLVSALRAARAEERAVAVHSVTAQSLALVIAGVREVGAHPGDRVEHAAVCDDGAADGLAELGVTVVTQPTIVVRRGAAMLSESEEVDRPWLWRVRGLQERGVRVVLSSDAPYGDPSPWATVRAASVFGGDGGRPFAPREVVGAGWALRSYATTQADPAGAARVVKVGADADLCLLDATVPEVLARVRAGADDIVRSTFVAGKRVA